MTPDPIQERTHRYTEAIRDVYHSEIFDWVPETAERIMAIADAEQAALRAHNATGRANLAHYREKLDEFAGLAEAAQAEAARVQVLARAVVAAWDDTATTEPCGDCVRSGIALLTFDDDERISDAVEALRTELGMGA